MSRGVYDPDMKPVILTKKSVDGIQLQGGTILGTSRGGSNIKWVHGCEQVWMGNSLGTSRVCGGHQEGDVLPGSVPVQEMGRGVH